MAQADFTPYLAFWRKRNRLKPTPEARASAEAARHEAARLSHILATEFGAKRVYLFGSFAWGLEPRFDSDLDLAMEGLPRGKLVYAHARLSSASRYPVDLVLLERLPDLLRKRILKSGVLLYDYQSDQAIV